MVFGLGAAGAVGAAGRCGRHADEGELVAGGEAGDAGRLGLGDGEGDAHGALIVVGGVEHPHEHVGRAVGVRERVIECDGERGRAGGEAGRVGTGVEQGADGALACRELGAVGPHPGAQQLARCEVDGGHATDECVERRGRGEAGDGRVEGDDEIDVLRVITAVTAH